MRICSTSVCSSTAPAANGSECLHPANERVVPPLDAVSFKICQSALSRYRMILGEYTNFKKRIIC